MKTTADTRRAMLVAIIAIGLSIAAAGFLAVAIISHQNTNNEIRQALGR